MQRRRTPRAAIVPSEAEASLLLHRSNSQLLKRIAFA
jgi:hypothetical protein